MTSALLDPPAPADDGTRRELLLAGATLALGFAACGGEDEPPPARASTRTVRDAYGPVRVPRRPSAWWPSTAVRPTSRWPSGSRPPGSPTRSASSPTSRAGSRRAAHRPAGRTRPRADPRAAAGPHPRARRLPRGVRGLRAAVEDRADVRGALRRRRDVARVQRGPRARARARGRARTGRRRLRGEGREAARGPRRRGRGATVSILRVDPAGGSDHMLYLAGMFCGNVVYNDVGLGVPPQLRKAVGDPRRRGRTSSARRSSRSRASSSGWPRPTTSSCGPSPTTRRPTSSPGWSRTRSSAGSTPSGRAGCTRSARTGSRRPSRREHDPRRPAQRAAVTRRSPSSAEHDPAQRGLAAVDAALERDELRHAAAAGRQRAEPDPHEARAAGTDRVARARRAHPAGAARASRHSGATVPPGSAAAPRPARGAPPWSPGSPAARAGPR